MKIKYFVLALFLFIIACTGKNEIKPLDDNPSEIIQNKTSEEVTQVEKKETKKKKVKHDTSKKMNYNKFTKGIYLTAYNINSGKYHTILDSAEAAGMNTVVFDLRNMNGHVFFPIPQNGFLSNENMKTIIDIGEVVNVVHERDMRAVARLVMFHDQITAQRDSTYRPKSINGNAWVESKRKKASWLDSSNSQVQNTLLEIIEEVAKNGVDEIQMDYVRFPTQGKISEAIFSFQEEDTSKSNKDSTYVNRQKSDIIEAFVTKAKRVCDKYSVTLTADVFAIVSWQREADINATGQDIQKMSQNLDAIHPMIYSSHFSKNFGFRENLPDEPYHIVYKGSSLSKKYANKNCRVIPYIQSNSWKVNYGYDYMAGQIQAVKDSGSDGYILWNASNKYYKTLRWIRKFDKMN